MRVFIIVLVSSLAIASCSPTLGLVHGLLGGHDGDHGAGVLGGVLHPVGAVLGLKKGHGGGNADKGYLKKGGVYPVGGGGILQALGFLGQGISDVLGNARSILDDVVHLRIPGIIDDGFNAISSVSRAAGGIINAVIPGLGSLLGNIVVSVSKILTCVLGSPGLTGTILDDRRPGRDNPVDIPAICRKDWGKKYGWDYDGPCDSPGEIISHYKVGKAKQQALQLINKYTKGRGLNGLTAQERIVCERIIAIAEIIDSDSSTWSDKDIKTLVINVIIVVSVLGDSYESELGTKIADEWITFFKKNNKNKRFPDLSSCKDEIYRAIKNIKRDKWNGAFRDTKDSDKNDSDDNNNDSNNSSGHNNKDNDSNSDNDNDRDGNDNNAKDKGNDSESNNYHSKNNDSDARNSKNSNDDDCSDDSGL